MNFHEQNIMHIKDLTLKVKDLNKMIAFYTEIMGMVLIEQSETKAILGTKTKALLTLEQNDAYEIQARTEGLYHAAYLLPTQADLANFVFHLMKHKVEFGAGDHYVSEAMYFDDPEGNGIEVYADRDPKTWTWKTNLVEMATVAVDFEKLLNLTTHEFKTLPDDTQVGHIHLQVKNLQDNELFYKDSIGFDLVSELPAAYFLSDGKYHHHIAFNGWLGRHIHKASDKTTGLKSFTIHVSTELEKDFIISKLHDHHFELKEDGVLDPNGVLVKFEYVKEERGN